MKRILLLGVMVGLFTGQASAAMWEVDRPTALGFTSYTLISGILTGDLSVYNGYFTKIAGSGPSDYGGSNGLGPAMSGDVGFSATLSANVTGGFAELEIYHASPGLTDTTTYSAISMYVQNDNNSRWAYQLFYVNGGGSHDSGAFVPLDPYGQSTVLTIPGSVVLAGISDIGFRIQGHFTSVAPEPSSPDAFHTSVVVPVPAALLLGLLGLGAAGLKLRRFA
jgi:hypothetical protein